MSPELAHNRGIPSPSSSCSAPRSFLAAARRAPLDRRTRCPRFVLPGTGPGGRGSTGSRRPAGRGAGCHAPSRPRPVPKFNRPRSTRQRGRRAAAETLDPAAPEVLSSSDTAAFAQDVPAGADLRPEPSLTGEADDDAAAPAATIVRPPPPPDPGTGLSTIVEGGTNGRLEVALTFDAGADTGYAAEILDLLRDEGIKATFGMTGVWAEANPDLVRRMVAEGHQLINHTWDHSSLTGANTGMPPLTPEQVAQQLADTEAVVRDLTWLRDAPLFPAALR